MALTPEQQAEIQIDVERQKFRIEAEIASNLYEKEQQREVARRAHEIAVEQRRARLELVRLAKETLIENARSKPVDARDVSASDVTNFADTLAQYVNQ